MVSANRILQPVRNLLFRVLSLRTLNGKSVLLNIRSFAHLLYIRNHTCKPGPLVRADDPDSLSCEIQSFESSLNLGAYVPQ